MIMDTDYPRTEKELQEMNQIKAAIRASQDARRKNKKTNKRRLLFNRWLRFRRYVFENVIGIKRRVGAEYCACGAKKQLSEKRCTECADAICVIAHRVAYKYEGGNAHDYGRTAWEAVPRPLRVFTPGMYETDSNNSVDDIIKAYEDCR